MRQPGPCVRALCDSDVLFQRSHLKFHTSHCTLHTAHFTLHTSHLHFTVHTSSHLILSELFSPHFSSFHLISSFLMSDLGSSQLFSFHLSSVHRLTFQNFSSLEALLNSSQLFCTSESFSSQREVSCAQKPLRTESFCTKKFLQCRGKGGRSVGFRRCAVTLPGAGGAATLRRCDAPGGGWRWDAATLPLGQ